MNPESIKLITEYLDKIAAQIGVTGQQVWPWLIKQQYVKVYYAIGFSIGLVFLGALMFVYIKKYWDFIEENDLGVLVFTLSFVTSMFFLFSVLYLMFNGQAIFNPEYYALKDLFKMIKP